MSERKRAVIDFIIREIEGGKYKKDSKLPSDREMLERFELSRFDVRKAFAALESMGYVYSLQGRGRFARRTFKRISFNFLDSRGFSQKLKVYGEVKTENLRIEKINYNERIFKELELSIESSVYKLLRIRYIDDFPVAYHISYLNGDVFKNIEREGAYIREISNYYKLYDIENTENKEIRLKVQYAKKEIREILKCTELIPIVKSEHVVLGKEKRIEFTEIFYRGDVFEFNIH